MDPSFIHLAGMLLMLRHADAGAQTDSIICIEGHLSECISYLSSSRLGVDAEPHQAHHPEVADALKSPIEAKGPGGEAATRGPGGPIR